MGKILYSYLGREANQKALWTPLLQCFFWILRSLMFQRYKLSVSSWPQTSTSKKNISFGGLEWVSMKWRYFTHSLYWNDPVAKSIWYPGISNSRQSFLSWYLKVHLFSFIGVSTSSTYPWAVTKCSFFRVYRGFIVSSSNVINESLEEPL